MQIFFQGNVQHLSSFSLVNGHLIAGLERLGYNVTVFPSDYNGSEIADSTMGGMVPDTEIPAIYLFHGHPYDVRSAPGRMNVFILNYEYSSIKKADASLIPRLNAVFDLVLVPTQFVKDVLIGQGLNIPVEIIPWAVDPQEFNPFTPPENLPASKHFVFLYVGAVNQRKGVDQLLKAYFEEFTAQDDVVLVIKEAFRHPTYEAWADALEHRYCHKDEDAPEILWIHEHTQSVSGYYTAANAGVFPHRGEGFGLPILECIASGRRVIVTDGTGPTDFCSSDNCWRIRARTTRSAGQTQLEPDRMHLRSLMRTAFLRGRPAPDEALHVSQTVKDWTWQRTVASLDQALRKHLRRSSTASKRRCRKSIGIKQSPAVAYAFYEKGPASWKKVCAETDRALRNNFAKYRPFSCHERFDLTEVDIIVGQSEHCLERLIKATQLNPRVLKIVHQECTVLGDRVATLNRERKICGLESVSLTPMNFWRNKTENALADYIRVSSSVARRFFLENGFPDAKIKVIPEGIKSRRCHRRENIRTLRFLFVGTDPLRKGIRHLFEAWDRAKLKNAELVCVTNLEILNSPLLLKYLVKNPNILIKPPVSHRAFVKEYEEVDYQVLPSLEDTFSVSVGDGMGFGKPAIVSTNTGIQDLITHNLDGYIVKAGDVEELKQALIYFSQDRERLHEMGEAAYETARKYPWSRFRRDMSDLIHSLYEESAR